MKVQKLIFSLTLILLAPFVLAKDSSIVTNSYSDVYKSESISAMAEFDVAGMTPEVFGLNSVAGLDEFAAQNSKNLNQVIPVFDEDKKNVRIVNLKDYLVQVREKIKKTENFIKNKPDLYWTMVFLRASIPAGATYVGMSFVDNPAYVEIAMLKASLIYAGTYLFGAFGDEYLKSINNRINFRKFFSSGKLTFLRNSDGTYVPSNNFNVFSKATIFEILFMSVISLPQFLIDPSPGTFIEYLENTFGAGSIGSFAASAVEGYLRQYAQCERKRLGISEDMDFDIMNANDLAAFLKTKAFENRGMTASSIIINTTQTVATIPGLANVGRYANTINLFAGLYFIIKRNQLIYENYSFKKEIKNFLKQQAGRALIALPLYLNPLEPQRETKFSRQIRTPLRMESLPFEELEVRANVLRCQAIFAGSVSSF